MSGGRAVGEGTTEGVRVMVGEGVRVGVAVADGLGVDVGAAVAVALTDLVVTTPGVGVALTRSNPAREPATHRITPRQHSPTTSKARRCTNPISVPTYDWDDAKEPAFPFSRRLWRTQR